ncbi:alpha/beta-hydrolase [Schizopora paradoxa]|uniref:Alpha/beta-hydrolase n=1 Tax=Schizopora paradoxa TaxID=27342 RepID=A0A0H2RWW8_9AGAM|nr:alpha/beta-hydrolase [Schizopora paradoxa]
MVAYPDTDSDSDNAHMSTSADDAMDSDSVHIVVDSGDASSPELNDVDGPTIEITHPTLHTKFVGVQHPASVRNATVHQYRGIKYATVPKRFRRSVLLQEYPEKTLATRHGAICPQIKNRWLESRLYGLPPEIVPKPSDSPPEDEWECLNLCITTPAPECLRKHGLVPVMVYFHGGGNVTGSGTEWIWDAGALVRKSVQCGRPVVVVALNFRLGLFGFAASQLLREDNEAAGEEGVGNYGLHDQRTALLWIKKYISGFGGDPELVTLFGSSWGAADIHAHLLSNANQADITGPDPDKVLFHRAILQSGALVPSNSVVQDVFSAGAHLGRIMQSLDIKSIDELREVPAAKLVSVTGERVRPVDDGVFLRRDWKSLALPFASSSQQNPRRVCRQDIMIGDVACESVLWAIPARLWGADAVARRARAIVQSVRRADTLMRAYDIVEAAKNSNPGSPMHGRARLGEDNAFMDSDDEGVESSDDEGCELAERVMDLINDVAFAWPVDVAARSAADSAFIFEEPSPPKAEGNDYLSAGGGYLSAGSESSLSPSPSGSESNLSGMDSTPQPTHHHRPPNAPFVYRYVFDQASPYTQTPHHGVDLLYLFGNIPFPTDPDLTAEENEEVNWDRVKVRSEMQERWLVFAHGEEPWEPLTPQPPAGFSEIPQVDLPIPMLSPSSSFSYGSPTKSTSGSSFGGYFTPSDSSRSSSFSHSGALHLDAFPPADPGSRSAAAMSPFLTLGPHKANAHGHMHQPLSHRGGHTHAHHHHHHHSRFHGKAPPSPAEHQPISISESDKVFVFGPEGETGSRSAKIFAGRRRVHAWREALAPLGLATAQKVGQELGNGPPVNGVRF